MKKKIIIILLIFILSMSELAFASEINFSEDRGVLLFEEKSDTFLYKQNADERFYPASTTKIMTALLVLENLNLDDKITVGDEITLTTSDSSTADLKQGEECSVEELLYGLLVVSGNDVAYTFAREVGSKVGNTDETNTAIEYFVTMMNSRAKELGANSTHFVNPHGLHDEDHYSTPKDMLILTRELLKFDIIKKIVRTPVYTLDTNLDTHKWASTNVFLHTTWDAVPNTWYKGANPYYTSEVTGVKTGSTNAAGKCIIFSAEKDNMNLIGIIYHSTFDDIWREGINLLDFAVDHYDYLPLTKESQEIDNLKLSNSSDTSQGSISVITKEDIPILIETNRIVEVLDTQKIEYDDKLIVKNEDDTYKLKRDLNANQVIGRVSYITPNNGTVESDVYAAYSIEKRNFLDFLFHWQMIFLSIVLLLLILRRSQRKKKRRRIKRKRR